MFFKKFFGFLFLFCFFIFSKKNICAANFKMQTGYYVGTGASLTISNIGFQPNLVIIKADTNAGIGAVWKSSTMAANTTAYFPVTANDTTTQITINANGFTVGSGVNVNTVNILWKWVAFGGSDCSANGSFCVGSYTGNGGASQAIASVGFQPDLVWVKGSGATAATWRSSAMGASVGQYFTATTQNTAGALFTTLNSNGFTVGSTNNANTIAYQYVAFKNISGLMGVGSYTGNATDNTNISAVNFGGVVPDFVFLKNANATTAQASVFNTTECYGDYSNSFIDAANAVNNIQSLQTGGFQIGTGTAANGSANTIYYAAFGGTVDYSADGNFDMAVGSYFGTGSNQSISGFDFNPDLVFIKNIDTGNTQPAVFRTSLIEGDSTAYFSGATANSTGMITSLGTNNFSIGTSAPVNTSGNTYYWEAFGNAFNPITNSGASDFVVGAYTGNGIDNRNITRIPFQPNMVTVKRSAANGMWRSSSFSGDISSYFGATIDTADMIQSLNSDGFQVGTNTNVNAAGSLYWWFGFKNGSNFTVNNYTGTGASQNINTVGFNPDLIWIKRSTAVNGVFRSSSLVGDYTQYFSNLANVSDRITGFLPNGFTIGGNRIETNTSAGIYHYAVWRRPNSKPVINSATDTPDPIGVDSDITFNTNWSDSDPGDSVKMFVCKTNSLTSQFTGGCADGAWFVSDSFTNSNPQIGTYTAQSGDIGTKDYFVFVCDSRQISNSCSDSSFGTFTVSPPVSVTLDSDGTIDYGILSAKTSENTLNLLDTQIVKNDSGVIENLNIKTSNAIGGTPWTPGLLPGNNIFVHEFSIDDGLNWTRFASSDNYQTLVNNLGIGETKHVDFRITVPESSSDYQQKSISITIQAVQP